MNKFTFFILISIIFQNSVFSQKSITENYPLKIGNTFVFKYYSHYFFPPAVKIEYHKAKVVDSLVIFSRKYYGVTDYPIYTSFRKVYLRLDSLTGNLFMFDSANSCPNYFRERLVDSLWASLNDTVRGCGANGYSCNDTNHYVVFDSTKLTKKFFKKLYCTNCTEYAYRRYAKGFGLIYNYYSYSRTALSTVGINLKGCVIDQVVYGDTTVPVSSGVIVKEVPLYTLQHVISVFNSNATINYEITDKDCVKVEVMDIKDKVIKTLVHEIKTPGNYSAELLGGDLPSGSYFFNLYINEKKVDTMKVYLLKWGNHNEQYK